MLYHIGMRFASIGHPYSCLLTIHTLSPIQAEEGSVANGSSRAVFGFR